MPETVLILSASVGSGHVRAAAAVEQAARRLLPHHDVQHLDILAYTNAMYRRLAAKTYVNLVQDYPNFMAYMYDRMDRPFAQAKMRAVLNSMNFGGLVRTIEAMKPKVVITSHFISAEILGSMKERGRLEAPLGVCVTDLDVHAIWLAHGVDHYFLAMPESREYLMRLGVDGERIHLSGIPIDAAFSKRGDEATCRRELGLDPARPIVLVASGGVGLGPTETIVDQLLSMSCEVQATVICGHNEGLRMRMEKKLQGLSDRLKGRLHVCGFTKRMHDYMSAATLLVGKPGGLSLSEAMAMELPMAIVHPLPGQEERNTDHLLEQGAAVRCNNLPTLGWKVEQLLRDQTRLEAMRAAARRLGKPRAAETVVRTMLPRETSAETAPQRSMVQN